MRRPLAVLVVLASAALAAGCTAQQEDSSAEFAGTEQAVAEAVERLQTAGQQRDAEQVCGDVLTKELAAQLRRGRVTCATLLDDALDDADSFELEVQDVTVTGDRATARVLAGSGDGEHRATLGLAREGGDWRIADLGR